VSGLHARLVVHHERFRLDCELSVGPGEVVALLGPNGAGKTTALRALAGLPPHTSGRVVLAGTALDDPPHALPPEQRPVAVVFQDYLLFPHLSVLDNVAFGPQARGTARRAARAGAAAELHRLGVAELAERRPRELSGGQAQRVALARALATTPRLLLLDEPLAALDAATRLAVRTDLRSRLSTYDGSTLLVTHDLLDATVLAHRTVVLEQGQVVQEGSPAQVLAAPRTDYVAQLAGVTLLRGIARAGSVTLPGGATLPGGGWRAGAVFVAVPPAAVALHERRPLGNGPGWAVRVVSVEQYGDALRIGLDGPPPLVASVPADPAGLALQPGARRWAAVDPRRVRVYR